MLENSQEVDFIIVGQGLAGTLLSYFLLKEGQRLVVLDYPNEGRTSNIAAGLVNPVTGRRIAKSWRYEELYQFAKQTYQNLEVELGETFWHEKSIVRALHSVFEENEWLRRSGYPEFQQFMKDDPDVSEFRGKIRMPQAWGELTEAAQVAMPLLVESWRIRLLKNGLIVSENIDYQKIGLENEVVSYNGLKAKTIVFCEGAKAVENPFFNHLPFLPTKGELFLVRIPALKSKRIVKHKLFLVPLYSDLYWAGSTSRYEFEGPNPTEAGSKMLMNDLEEALETPFEVISHLSGIRPTVADLRPFLGLHPQHPNMAIFNGLGTKGALMGPYFAKQMTDYLLGKGELEEEVDIQRFEKSERTGHFFKKD